METMKQRHFSILKGQKEIQMRSAVACFTRAMHNSGQTILVPPPTLSQLCVRLSINILNVCVCARVCCVCVRACVCVLLFSLKNIHTLLLALRQAYELSLCSIYQT